MSESNPHRCRVEPVRPVTDAAGRSTTMLAFLISGMGCPTCAVRVQNALVTVNGVTAARVSLVPPIATVRFLPEQVGPEQLIAAVEHAGTGTHHEYDAYELDRLGGIKGLF